MPRIWTIGELLVEIMRPTTGVPLNEPGYFRGPFPSGAPAIFIDCAARLGLDTGIIGAVGDDDFGRCLTERLEKDGVDTNYQFIAAMTNGKDNLENLLRGLNPEYKDLIKTYDDLDHAIAAHWGPNAFGYIYVKAK